MSSGYRLVALLLFVTLWIYIIYEIKHSSMIILGGEFDPVCKYKMKVSNVFFLGTETDIFCVNMYVYSSMCYLCRQI